MFKSIFILLKEKQYKESNIIKFYFLPKATKQKTKIILKTK